MQTLTEHFYVNQKTFVLVSQILFPARAVFRTQPKISGVAFLQK